MLATFDAVARHRNFRRAAEARGVTSPDAGRTPCVWRDLWLRLVGAFQFTARA